jgi:putative hemolysin
MGTLWLEILGVVFLIALIGFFSASEVAVLSSRKSKMKELAEVGNRKAAYVLILQQNPERFLATVHLGVVFSLILASGLGVLLCLEHLVPLFDASETLLVRQWSLWLSMGAVVAAIGMTVVIFGELIPKSLALRAAERVALRIASPMHLWAVALMFPAKMLTFASNLFLVPFKDSTSFSESRISEEEFKLMLEEGTKTGVIDKTEQELIHSIFEFTDTTAKEVMIPRPDVVALRIDMPQDQLIKIVLEEGYSRTPVYRGTIDNVVGVVYTKDLLGLMEYNHLIILQDIIRPAFFIPEGKKISQLMRELQQKKMHMAVVVDEFGGTEGIVTMEDIIEEIVGEIHDEYDEELKDIEAAADGTYLVNGRIAIRDFNDRFQTEVPLADEYETLSGLLHKQAGRIPEVGEEIGWDDLVFTIMKKSQRRIRLVRLRKKEVPRVTTTDHG